MQFLSICATQNNQLKNVSFELVFMGKGEDCLWLT